MCGCGILFETSSVCLSNHEKDFFFFSEMLEEFDISKAKCIYMANSVLLTKYFSGDQIKKNEIGRACGMFGEERCIQGFGGET